MARPRCRWPRPLPALLLSSLWAWLVPFAHAQGLAELYAAALLNNPTLQAREFDVERSRAESDAVRSRLLPQLAAQGSLSANEFRDSVSGDQSYGGKRLSLSGRQGLYDPATRSRLEATRATVVQREQELAQTRLVLLDELLDRYLQALAAQDEQAWLTAESQAAAQQVERLRVMRERQMARVTDLAEAQAYVLNLATRAIDAANQRAVALARLAELCGQPVERVQALARTTFDPPSDTPQSWLEAARHGHPRLLALQQTVEAMRRVVDASRAEHMPQVAATLSRIYADQGFDNRRLPPYHSASVGIELRMPLYEGGRVQASVRDALARQGSAEQQLEAARREIDRETLSLWLSARANHARIRSTDAEVAALEQTVQAQERGLELGASRVIDVLDARRRLLKARADQAKARYDYIRDVVALQVRSGEVGQGDIARWDGWFEVRGR
jgi:outer membrane protein